MEWLNDVLFSHSPIQAVVVISLISAIGLALGRYSIAGVSLGVTFVFFIGILAGHLGLSIEPTMLQYAQSFGLVIFVYALGLQVGPGFFGAFRKGGLFLNGIAFIIVLLGSVMTLLFHYTLGLSLPDMVGVLSGAVTNTPALGAAQQTLSQLGIEYTDPALGCAVTYPLGVVGVIIAIVCLNKLVKTPDKTNTVEEEKKKHNTFVVEFIVTNPGIFNKTIREIAVLSSRRFVISRIWRSGSVIIPGSQTVLKEQDRLLVITETGDVETLKMLFGTLVDVDWNAESVDWNKIDGEVQSHSILITRSRVNGTKLGDLRLRNRYNVNITRIYRSGVQLLPSPDLVLQYGDRVVVVGEVSAISAVEELMGNRVATLKEPNLISVFIGLVLGLGIGMIPIAIPGIEYPVRIGLAGGPIIVGLLMGAFGPRLHFNTYTTRSANLMLRALGLSMYLACLGLDAGRNFFDTVFRTEGLLWLVLGFLITFIPPLLVGFFMLITRKMDRGSVYGMICGSMSNPMALTYANSLSDGDASAVAYATVYPLTMFIRVVIAQLILIFFI